MIPAKRCAMHVRIFTGRRIRPEIEVDVYRGLQVDAPEEAANDRLTHSQLRLGYMGDV